VMAPPASARGTFALAATGFAGSGDASAIDPQGLYPSLTAPGSQGK
jgi:hypothetical protein